MEEFEYGDFISLPNLFQAWNKFKLGKRKKKDVMAFERFLETNLYNLYLVLKNKTYKHSNYQSFYIQDPKLRHIHKASVSDRVVHHLLHEYLYEVFDKTFIFDSYSCRLNKGTHKGIKRVEYFARKISRNYTQPCWALKLDIKKFFASVDHQVLLDLLKQRVKDTNIIWLLQQVLDSFHSENGEGKGIPLGNLTSQVFANINMNELDQFVKHQLKIKFYIRYADDFVILAPNNKHFDQYINLIKAFLMQRLKLELHPKKVIIRKLDWGIDFLGYVVLPHYILPRTKTKKRIFSKLKAKIKDENFNQSLQSYLGYLSHANTFNLTQNLKNQVWLWQDEL